MKTLDDLFAEDEAQRLAEANTPERLAEDAAMAERNRVRSEAEFQRGVELGWFDQDGNSLLPDDPEDEDDDQ